MARDTAGEAALDPDGDAELFAATDGRVPGRRGRATRLRLLESTADLLATTPWRSIKVIDIARQAGTSPATFYQYFENVEQAILVMAEELMEGAGDLAELVDGDWSPSASWDTARRVVEGFMAYWETNRSVFRVVELATEEGDLRFQGLRVRALNAVTVTLARVIATTGVTRPSSPPAADRAESPTSTHAVGIPRAHASTTEQRPSGVAEDTREPATAMGAPPPRLGSEAPDRAPGFELPGSERVTGSQVPEAPGLMSTDEASGAPGRAATAPMARKMASPAGGDAMAVAATLISMLAHVAAHRYGFEFWGIRTTAMVDSQARVLHWAVTGREAPAVTAAELSSMAAPRTGPVVGGGAAQARVASARRNRDD
jgi:AcrR family transcriptional regulator